MKFIKKNWSTLLLVLMLIIGLCLLAYPTVANWWNSMHQSRAIASYVQAVDNLDDEDYDRILEEAKEYNKKLRNHFVLSEKETEEYNKTLDITGTGIMGYVNIPKIRCQLPIYHGTDDGVLQIAIGHIPGSSLPVGGKGTHCVLSGHRGLPSAKLFSNLDQMEIGDTFQLQVLNETLTYEVDQILIVDPDDMSDLKTEDGKDYCTLVTCTPYGINTHRLLVRGHRVKNGTSDVRVTADAMQIEPVMVAPVIAIPILIALIIYVLFSTRKSKRKVVKKDE